MDQDLDEGSDVDFPTSSKRSLVRQYSDPTSQQTLSSISVSICESKSNQLTVPNAQLIKQISDSELPLQSDHRELLTTKEDLYKQTIVNVSNFFFLTGSY